MLCSLFNLLPPILFFSVKNGAFFTLQDTEYQKVNILTIMLFILNIMLLDQIIGMRDLARDFFALPNSEKEKISITNTDLSRGYQRLGQNITKYAKDWHEAIDYYAPVPPSNSSTSPHLLNTLSTPCLKGTNPYPSYPPHFQQRVESYVEACKKVGAATMRAMAVGLGLEETFFESMCGDSFWVLRMIGYPPLKRKGDDAQGGEEDGVGMSCGEHTDYGCLTVL